MPYFKSFVDKPSFCVLPTVSIGLLWKTKYDVYHLVIYSLARNQTANAYNLDQRSFLVFLAPEDDVFVKSNRNCVSCNLYVARLREKQHWEFLLVELYERFA